MDHGSGSNALRVLQLVYNDTARIATALTRGTSATRPPVHPPPTRRHSLPDQAAPDWAETRLRHLPVIQPTHQPYGTGAQGRDVWQLAINGAVRHHPGSTHVRPSPPILATIIRDAVNG